MERRLLVVLAAAAVGVVAVGLSAAATMSRSDSAQPATEIERVKAATKPVARAASKQKAADRAPVVVSSGRSQSSEEVEQYWTKERMEDAQPMEKTRPGKSGDSTPASPTPSGVRVPGSAPTKSAPAKKPSTKRATSASQDGVVSSPAVSTPNYWTDEMMADAQPMDNTRPGGTGSQSDPGSSGATVPGSPPP